MFSRLDHEIAAVLFPKDWAEGLKQILLNIYGDKCLRDDKTFEVYGFSYPNEVLMIVSYTGLDKFVAPITLHLSADLNDKTKTDAILNDMFDSIGVFFDAFFAKDEGGNGSNGSNDEIWDDYILDWEETNFNNQSFFYKVTRENIALSIEADLLLGE
jgi:hypothetical protein